MTRWNWREYFFLFPHKTAKDCQTMYVCFVEQLAGIIRAALRSTQVTRRREPADALRRAATTRCTGQWHIITLAITARKFERLDLKDDRSEHGYHKYLLSCTFRHGTLGQTSRYLRIPSDIQRTQGKYDSDKVKIYQTQGRFLNLLTL